MAAETMAQADAALSADTPVDIESPPEPSGDAPPESTDGVETPSDQPTPPTSDAPDTEPVVESPDPKGTEPEPVAPDYSAYPAFKFKAAGAEHEYEGSYEDKEGNVLFTPSAVQQLRADLAHAKAYPKLTSDSRRQEAALKLRAEAAEASLAQVVGTFDDLVEQSQGATTLDELIQTPLGQWLLKHHRDWPITKEKSRALGLEMRSKADREELTRLQQEREDVEQRPEYLDKIAEAVEHYGKQANLPETVRKQLVRRYSDPEWFERVFPRAEKDDPVTGLRAGQRQDQRADLIRREILFLYESMKHQSPAEQKQTVAAVTKENDARMGKTAPKPPPTASVAGAKVAPTQAKRPTYKNMREADDDIWKD